jgi:hypothetical protein
MQEALNEGRTLVWFKNTLLARPPQMREMLAATLSITRASYLDESNLLTLEISNRSDVDFELLNQGELTFSRNTQLLTIGQHASTRLIVKTEKRLDRIELDFQVLNALVAPRQPARLVLSAPVSDDVAKEASR